ncbi:MAG: hypothetical protein ACYCXG_00905 [Acidiferrobacter sp.]
MTVRAQLRTYLAVLGVADEWQTRWVDLATDLGVPGGQPFLQLQALMAREVAAGEGDEAARAALWRLSRWLQVSPGAIEAMVTPPPLERRSMASERRRR